MGQKRWQWHPGICPFSCYKHTHTHTHAHCGFSFELLANTLCLCEKQLIHHELTFQYTLPHNWLCEYNTHVHTHSMGLLFKYVVMGLPICVCVFGTESGQVFDAHRTGIGVDIMCRFGGLKTDKGLCMGHALRAGQMDGH